jgi:hypothetical protein
VKESAGVLSSVARRSTLLCNEAVDTIATDLITLLYVCKHQGILLNVYLSLEAVCRAVSYVTLQCWLQRLLDDLLADGNPDQWLRRSAGVPFCFLAVLHACDGQRQRR